MAQKTEALRRAIDSLRYFGAWSASLDLQNAIRYATAQLQLLDVTAHATAAQELHTLAEAAATQIARAPLPSPAAIREATSIRDRNAPRPTWDAEQRAWIAAHGDIPDAPAANVRTHDAVSAGVRASAGSVPPDLGNYDSPVGKHVLVLRRWDDTEIAARRVELQGRLSRTADPKGREELLREYEAIEWVARERNLPLPKDPGEEAAPQAYAGGTPIKFWVPDTAQGMRAMLEREMAAGSGYEAALDHAQLRIGYGTLPQSETHNDKRLIGDQQIALMDRDAAVFRSAFPVEVKLTALSMLDASTAAIDHALRSYGIAAGRFRLSDAAHKVARDPGVLDAEVDQWVALSSRLDDNRTAFAAGHGKREDLAREARQLRDLQDNLAALSAEQLRLTQLVQAQHPEHPGISRPAKQPDWRALDTRWARPQPMTGSVQTPFDRLPRPAAETPAQQLAFVRGALRARQAQFQAAWIQAERQHPALAAYRGTRAPDATSLADLGSDEATTRSVVRHVLPKLGHIYRTKAALQGSWGTLDPLQLAPAVELTRQRMFVAQGSYRDRVVHDLVAQAHDKAGIAQWALEAVMIGLTLVTLVPTAGASAAAGLALTGLAYDVYMGLGEYEEFQVMTAAADTDLDKLRSLSDLEPSLTPLLTRIVGAGVNLTVAAGLFRRAVALRRMALERGVAPDTIAALNEAGEAAGIKGIAEEAVAEVQLTGTAAFPRVRFRPNPNHEVRSLSEALQIAERNGIDVDPERFRFAIGRGLPDHVGAKYFELEVTPGRIIDMKSLLDKQGRFVIRLNPNILGSDDKILGVIAHEVFEIESLEREFIANGGRLEARRVFALIDAEQGAAHSAAWDHADQLIERLQEQGRYP